MLSTKGTFGDTLFAFLCGCGHNIRKILAHLRALFALLIKMLLNALPGAGPDHQAIKAA
jgi:IS5 family transposase